MECIFFTKQLREMEVEEVGREVAEMGFAGIDLAVRDGYCVHPDNVATALPAAVDQWADMGLAVPMVTTPGEFTDPDQPLAETMLAACAEAGVHEIKLGYWHWREPGYWPQVDAIRAALDGFARLADKHGVRCAVHTHSGAFYGLNAAATMHLVRAFDPRLIGVYLDPGHLSINGEPVPMALDMVADYLCLVAVKNFVYVSKEQEGEVHWSRTLAPLRKGLVDWPAAVEALRAVGYDGPLSFHSEYHNVSLDELRALTRDDLNYLSRFVGA
ncbi:MAG: sugar phosphate isomerase/epimerase family protein [Planctomycetota bacterium]